MLFFKKIYLFMRDTQRERQRHRQRKKQVTVSHCPSVLFFTIKNKQGGSPGGAAF